MSKRKKIQHEEGESPIGFVMFGDLMSQLLCFFILLFVFASQYVSKTQGTTYEEFLKKISDNFKKVVEEKKVLKKETVAEKQKSAVQEEKAELKIAKEIITLVNNEKLNDYISVILEEKKIRIILQQPILFDSGHAELKESAKGILSDIGQILMKVKNPIDIEGHTDTVPIHTDKYDSNWDLSFDRAYSVIKYMVNEVKMSPLKMHAIGYGEYRPIVPNDTDEDKAKNRRVEINIYLNEKVTVN
ncbi:MAG: OmpA family protein [Candidatus Margulisbacteria bacterium]|nr:OmpA family protein [Candidatus Margulisiibacteriota bacterium]